MDQKQTLSEWSVFNSSIRFNERGENDESI